ncbi:sugar ABC transporter permease [Actinoallomurus purpureus]|uniref:carbohydrate ABC transporter permease n=1 Tax=Actinoallomurus purpureus TaxID=478114 RepID=UPI0020924DE2|nr:sugar ABC transporter permease [Actinoallomurus purpureus]MCO6003484.1 sugar ABC transporter permease [Actinoallomurus purpureus]
MSTSVSPRARFAVRSAGRRAERGRPRSSRSRWSAVGFIVPAWAYVACFYLYPLVSNVRMGFQNYTVASFYTGRAPYVGLANYRAVLHGSEFWPTVANTVVFTVASLVVQFSIGLALAMFFRRAFPLNGTLRSLLLVPWLLPLVVSGTVWRWMLDNDSGVLNQALLQLHVVGHPVPWLVSTKMSLIAVTLVNIWVGIPFNMVILYGGLQAIPEQVHEAAAIDGAGAWQRFRHVTLPLLRPVALVVLTLGLIYTIKVFDIIMIVTQGGPVHSSQTLTTYAYDLSFQELTFGRGAAVGNVLILVAIVFAAVYLRSTRETEGGTR